MIDKLPQHPLKKTSISTTPSSKASKAPTPKPTDDINKTLTDNNTVGQVTLTPQESKNELRLKLIYETLTHAWGDNISNESEFKRLVEKINTTLKDSAFIEEQLNALQKELNNSPIKKPKD